MSSPIIKRLVKKNPRREGTEGWKAWNLLKKGMTYDQYLRAGGRRDHLAWDLNKGNVKLVLDGKRVGIPAPEARAFVPKGTTVVQRMMDDSKVKHLRSNKRWTAEFQYDERPITVKNERKESVTMMGRIRKPTIFVSPKGRRYVEALPTERADLIVRVGKDSFWGGTAPERRLRKYATSAVARKEKRQHKEKQRDVKRHVAKKKHRSALKVKNAKPAKWRKH